MKRLTILALVLVCGSASAAQLGTALFTDQTPRFPTSSIEFHDPENELWPAYYHGKCGDSGSVELRDDGISGSFVVKAYGESMLRYANHRRLIGELLAGVEQRIPDPEREGKTKWAMDVPMPTMRIIGLSGTAEKKEGKKGDSYTWDVEVEAELEFCGRTVGLSGSGKASHADVHGKRVVLLNATFVVPGSELGLTEYAKRDVQIRLYTAGQMPGGGKKKKKKKR